MKLFLSWSGERSRSVAACLYDLVPEILQDVEPWMSEHDIGAGQRWGTQLNAVLEESAAGVLCLTRENLSAPWLLFEAGSLAKTIKDSRVIPYLLGLTTTDIAFPLAQFQGVDTSEAGTRRLLASINAARPSPMLDDRLDRMFVRWWPDLADRLSKVPAAQGPTQPVREERALLEEILEVTRRLGQSTAAPETRRVSFADWAKSVHNVQKSTVDQMDVEELEAYILAIQARDSLTSSEGEQIALTQRLEYARSVIDQRRARGA